ncbi:Unknown protein [Striga hermonthica]|uniref:Uncharacterized protein n=1 Tax=Striga hermonthica TaxID=68872 RepID=A0A9N7MTV6_STRHE|nr:Unknown protein [Striga hermonthica]
MAERAAESSSRTISDELSSQIVDSEHNAKETSEKLAKKREEHQRTRQDRAEKEAELIRLKEAHAAEISRLEKEKAEYGTLMRNRGVEAGKELGKEEFKNSEEMERDLEFNTCLNLRWTIDRVGSGLYGVGDLALILHNKIVRLGFDASISEMRVLADDDERDYVEGVLDRSDPQITASALPPLSRERRAELQRAFMDMFLYIYFYITMSGAGDEENDAVLSDVEADDLAPINIKTAPENMSVEKFKEILAELDRERRAREAAENAKSDLQVSFNRLKVLCHEAIKKRDECSRQRDETLREKEEALKKLEKASADLSEEIKLKEDITKQKDEIVRQLEEVGKARESNRIELETGSSMLVSGIEKISRKVSSYKDFGGNGLPKSSKYSGLPAVAYGVVKRTNEIVEELLYQIESSNKLRNEAREQLDQRNYEIAIEVSQLEATISGLREEVAERSKEIESLRQLVDMKDARVAELERESSERLESMKGEISGLSVLVSENESKIEAQRPMLINQLNYVSKVHNELCEVMKIVDADKSSELSEYLFVAQETNMEENIKACLAGMESVYELSKTVVEKTRKVVEERGREVKSLNETVSRLVKEKEKIGSLLRSTLSQRMSVDLSSKTNQLFKVAENGLKETGIGFQAFKGEVDPDETEQSEVYALASALENIIKQSQLEIIELQHSVEEIRAELNLYKELADAQAKELSQCKLQVEELEEKERVANENVEGLMMDVTSAEEEIMRWKVAAQQEADAGKAVEQEFVAQLAAARQELEEARQAVIETEKKLRFKEETALAAMAARDAAEKSLRLADMRAARLRDRVEELTRQLDELDTREATASGLSRPRYICWPWQWLGLNYVGGPRSETPLQAAANEMELSEPLI